MDIFSQIVPEPFLKGLASVSQDLASHTEGMPALYDLRRRFRVIERFLDVLQVATLALTAAQVLISLKHGSGFARLANDSMAELVAAYPDGFAAGVASVPTFDADAASTEVERAMKDLGLSGVQLFTPLGGRPFQNTSKESHPSWRPWPLSVLV